MTDHPTRPAIPAGLAAGGVVAIARHINAAKVAAIAGALADGGVRALELTLNDPEADALRAIESAASLYDYQAQPQHLEKMTFVSPKSGDRVSRMWQLPTSLRSTRTPP